MSLEPLVTAARRFLILLGATAGPTAIVGALVAALTTNGYSRSISVGMYAVGGLCIAAGFGVGTRNSLRRSGPGPGGRIVGPELHDVQESLAATGVLISVGLVLLVLGVIVDPRVRAV